jgi:hypothetical protein
MKRFYLALTWPGVVMLLLDGQINRAFIGCALLIGMIGIVVELVADLFRRWFPSEMKHLVPGDPCMVRAGGCFDNAATAEHIRRMRAKGI